MVRTLLRVDCCLDPKPDLDNANVGRIMSTSFNLEKSLLLYAITDRHWTGEKTLLEQTEEALEGGATFIQIREKDLDEANFEAEAIAATGHDHVAVVIAPTCLNQGYTTHTCHCGDSYKDNFLNHEHGYTESTVVAPTCTEGGYTTFT